MTNKLKVNPDKTKFLLNGNKGQRRKYLSMFPVELFGVKNEPEKSAWNLVIIIDKTFTFHSHTSTVCSSCFHHMRDLHHIRCQHDLDSAKLIATALVSSCLHYCNLPSYGIADIDITRFQQVQNQLARLVTKSPSFAGSLPLLHSLHWLPVRFRILVKVNLLTYKTLGGKQPGYSLHACHITSIPFIEIKQ